MSDCKIILVSPRKSGTHLITSILNTKYSYQGKIEICSDKSGYYSLEDTFHTSFNNYFYNLDRMNAHGGKLLPIKNMVGLNMIRHPADVFFSHFNFSFRNNNTAYSHLFFKNEKDKLAFIYENNNYENFFKSLFEYTSWTRLTNFLTISYEEVLYFKNNLKQSNLLNTFKKIDIDINKIDFAKEANFSDTFYKGEIGLGLNFIKKNCPKILKNEFYKKYCDFYGYKYLNVETPKHMRKINNKKIITNEYQDSDIPLTVNINFLNHTIFYYKKNLYALPRKYNFDFMKIKKFSPFFFKSKFLDEVKLKIASSNYLRNFFFRVLKILY